MPIPCDELDSYYALLGLPQGATMAQVRRAYRRLALELHPDRAGPATTARFQAIAEAYRALSDARAGRHAGAGQPWARRRAREHARRGWQEPRDEGPAPPAGARPGAAQPHRGAYEGPGGRFTWQVDPGPDPRSRRDLLLRLCGALDDLVARAVMERQADGVLEVPLTAEEARTGGAVEVLVRADVACPTCFGLAEPRRFWCRRCEYTGSVREDLTAHLPLAPPVADGAVFSVIIDPAGRAPPLRFRIRVAAGV